MMDVHRTTAKNLVYLAARIDESTIRDIHSGRLSYVRVLEETRLREAGATSEQIEHTRRLDLGRVKRFWQKLRKMTRTDERRIFDGQYISFQPSLDGGHYRVAGQLGGYEGRSAGKPSNSGPTASFPPPPTARTKTTAGCGLTAGCGGRSP